MNGREQLRLEAEERGQSSQRIQSDVHTEEVVRVERSPPIPEQTLELPLRIQDPLWIAR